MLEVIVAEEQLDFNRNNGVKFMGKRKIKISKSQSYYLLVTTTFFVNFGDSYSKRNCFVYNMKMIGISMEDFTCAKYEITKRLLVFQASDKKGDVWSRSKKNPLARLFDISRESVKPKHKYKFILSEENWCRIVCIGYD